MRHRILLVALAFSTLSMGVTYACSSPPVATTHDVGPLKVKKHCIYTPVEATVSLTALEPAMYSFNCAAIESLIGATSVVPASVSVSDKNCSKPQSTGLAIRQRVKRPVDVIHLLVVATSGHRLLHIDPGLC